MTNTESVTKPVLLAAPNSVLQTALTSAGFHVIGWPSLLIQRPENVTALDEAIQNIYGYDWILLINADSVRFFLERLADHEQDVSVLDALKVCAIGEAAATALAQAKVHVDVLVTRPVASVVVEQLAMYVGGGESLNRLNFLLPQAAIGRDYLTAALEDNGARADVVTAYQTVSRGDLLGLAALEGMLRTGSVEAVVFASPEEVAELSRLFDRNDLSALLRNTIVLTVDAETRDAALHVGICEPLQTKETGAQAILASLAKHFNI